MPIPHESCVIPKLTRESRTLWDNEWSFTSWVGSTGSSPQCRAESQTLGKYCPPETTILEPIAAEADLLYSNLDWVISVMFARVLMPPRP